LDRPKLALPPVELQDAQRDVDVSGLSGDTVEVLDLVVVGLKLVVGERPVRRRSNRAGSLRRRTCESRRKASAGTRSGVLLRSAHALTRASLVRVPRLLHRVRLSRRREGRVGAQ